MGSLTCGNRRQYGFSSMKKYLRQTIVVDRLPGCPLAKWRIVDRTWNRFQKQWDYRVMPA